MNKFPEFSVLISVYKKEKSEYLKQSIESILNQSVKPTEIVIVKDGDLGEDLNAVLGEYENNPVFKIIGYEHNRGLGLALKFGVENCKYDIIARMDSDDISDSSRFEKELSCLTENNFDLVGSNTIEFVDEINNVCSRRIMPECHDEIVEYSKTRNPFIHPSVMTYKKVILDAGNYRDFYLCEDYDLWTRILEKGNVTYNIQESLVYMRADLDFYKRRGGLKYCKSILKFKKTLRKKKYMTFWQYQKTKLATIVVSLMPGALRAFVYKKFLRK